MTVAGDLTRCSQCRLSVPDEVAARRHEQLDHTAAPDGVDVLQQLLGAARLPESERALDPVLVPEAGALLPGSDLGARLGVVLVVCWLVGFVALLVLLT